MAQPLNTPDALYAKSHPIELAKKQFDLAKLSFEISIQEQQDILDKVRGLPAFLADSFSLSRILQIFPQGCPFLTEVLQSNRSKIRTCLFKDDRAQDVKPKGGVILNTIRQLSPKLIRKPNTAKSPTFEEIEISVRLHYYVDSNIITIVEHTTDLVVDCGVIAWSVDKNEFLRELLSKSFGTTQVLKYGKLITDFNPLFSDIDFSGPPQQLSVVDTEISAFLQPIEVECGNCKIVRKDRPNCNSSFELTVCAKCKVLSKSGTSSPTDILVKQHIIIDLLNKLSQVTKIKIKDLEIIAEMILRILDQHKIKNFAILSLRNKPGLIYEKVKALKENLYGLLLFLLGPDSENIPIGVDFRIDFTEDFQSIGVELEKIENYFISKETFDTLRNLWDEYFTSNQLEKLIYYNSTVEINLEPKSIGNAKCNEKNCKTCPLISPTKTFTTGEKFKIYEVNDVITCNTNNVVYMLVCTICNQKYIGSTRNNLKEALGNHSMKAKQNSGTPVDVHAYEEHSNNREAIAKDKRCKFEKYGGINTKCDPMAIFKVIGLETTSPARLGERAKYWINELETYKPRGLNEIS